MTGFGLNFGKIERVGSGSYLFARVQLVFLVEFLDKRHEVENVRLHDGVVISQTTHWATTTSEISVNNWVEFNLLQTNIVEIPANV